MQPKVRSCSIFASQYREVILVLLTLFSLRLVVEFVIYVRRLVIWLGTIFNMCIVQPNKFHSFSFVLLLFLLLEVVHGVTAVVLEVLKVELRELIVEDIGS